MNGRAGVGDKTSENSELISLSKPAAELCIMLGNMLCQDVTDATRLTLSIGLQAFNSYVLLVSGKEKNRALSVS